MHSESGDDELEMSATGTHYQTGWRGSLGISFLRQSEA